MTAIIPAGVRKPKQKPSVEGTVGKIATAIIARCRNETYYSFVELKKGVADKLYTFNHEAIDPLGRERLSPASPGRSL